MTMNNKDHIETHMKLQKALDDLIADWVFHNPDIRLKSTPVIELMEWAYSQTITPTERDGSHG